MARKLIRLGIFAILIVFSISNIAYAQGPIQSLPYGPKVSDLQNKQDIINNFNEIKTIRANLTIINVKTTTPNAELKKIDANLQRYIEQLRIVRGNLVRHADTYENSVSDVFFSEQMVAITDCYIISLKHQQILIRTIESDVDEASTLFYSTYMIPIYYYLTQGDQLVAYTQTYMVIS